jgi:CubicO group peptidase (beta-lactamase class C family)
VTGFLIARGDSILVERYQYGRTDKHRLTSFSMAKTIIGLLIGIALEEGAIRSIDDPAEVYVPALAGTEYGRTPIKALLQMSSGVSFREDYADPRSDIYTLAELTLGQGAGGSLAAVKRFNTRAAPPGHRFSYASAESLVLGLVLAGATRRTVSDYASEKVWQPLGTEKRSSRRRGCCDRHRSGPKPRCGLGRATRGTASMSGSCRPRLECSCCWVCAGNSCSSIP